MRHKVMLDLEEGAEKRSISGEARSQGLEEVLTSWRMTESVFLGNRMNDALANEPDISLCRVRVFPTTDVLIMMSIISKDAPKNHPPQRVEISSS